MDCGVFILYFLGGITMAYDTHDASYFRGCGVGVGGCLAWLIAPCLFLGWLYVFCTVLYWCARHRVVA